MDTAGAAGQPATLKLGLEGFEYGDLYRPAKLRKLTEMFYRSVAGRAPELWQEFERYRHGEALPGPAVSKLLIGMSAELSAFIAQLFGIEHSQAPHQDAAREAAVIYRFKRDFVMRRAVRKHPEANGTELDALDADVAALLPTGDRSELATANAVLRLLEEEGRFAKGETPAALAARLDLFERWVAAAAALHRQTGAFPDWTSLDLPDELRFPDGLVKLVRIEQGGRTTIEGPAERLRRRDGFKLTDPRWDGRKVLDHANYCVLCQEREKDSCSRGYPAPRKEAAPARNALGASLTGCPLNERIGESHARKLEGDPLGA
ncbi:MAG: hypothetical protein KGJ86_10795, partial [Chloroflexota bacterium]|nr:hypothetical protein [Chloroflexota bacterium]